MSNPTGGEGTAQIKRVIDAHVHIYPEVIAERACENLGKFYDFPIEGQGTEDDLFATCRQTGITGFVLLTVATNGHQVQKVNDTVAKRMQEARAEGFEAYAFAGMHQDFKDPAAEVSRMKAQGLSGFKLHPDIQQIDINDRRLYPLYEALEAENMILFLHTGDERPQYRYSEPNKLRRLLCDFPKLRAVAAHFGGYRAWEEAERELYGHENIWYDCSSALWDMSPEQAVYLTRSCGSDRVMYGTDYPVKSQDNYMKLFEQLSLTDREKEDVLYNNAKRLLGEIR